MTQGNEGTQVGVYICHCGGNISDHVDVDRVAETVREVPGVAVASTETFMCSDPGQERIMEDIRSGKINRVVVASCAPALHELTFRGALQRAGLNPYLYEHANIREQVSWVHHGQAATEKASALIAAAVAKSRGLTGLDPIRVDAKQHAVVVGGGVAGLRAARDIAQQGVEVALIEKSPFLGGRTALLDRVYPTHERAGDLLARLYEEIAGHSRITIYTCAEIAAAEGYVGSFKVTVKQKPPDSAEDLERLDRYARSGAAAGRFIPLAGIAPGPAPSRAEEFVLETGSIVMATGFAPYVPLNGEYGYRTLPEVITLPDIVRHVAENVSEGDRLKIDGREIRRIAFIHCVGSRQIPGIHESREEDRLNEYCSRVCCSSVLAAANHIRETFPGTRVLDYYRDIRTYGRGQEALYDRASENGVLFFRFEPEEAPAVETDETGEWPLRIRTKDVLTFGEEVTAGVDLVVLAVGMEPADVTGLAEMMKLPIGADRFLLEVHPKLRPVEVANTGVLLAGACQAPMDIGESCAAAQAAAAKVSTLLRRGYVELDPFVARVNLDRCRGRGPCRESCPESAITLSEMRIDGQTALRTQVNPAACTGCGICVAVCPENAIDVDGWTLQQYEGMVDAIVNA